jgi:hypothetical protein
MKKARKTKDPLAVLFGSDEMVKLLRFVLSNPEKVLALSELSTKLRCKLTTLRKLVKTLISIGCVRTRQASILMELSRGKISKKATPGIVYDPDFIYGESLAQLLRDSVTLRTHEIPKRIMTAGKPDLIIATGFFTNSMHSHVDLLVSGKNIDRKKFETVIAGIESDLGREIRYALMTTDELIYRLNMYDQFLRTILDFPHEKLLIKIYHADL